MEGYAYRDLRRDDVGTCLDRWVDRMAGGYPDEVLQTNVATGVRGYAGTVPERDGRVV